VDNVNKMANGEPELITIVEGPEPEFAPHSDGWALSLLEGDGHIGLEQCRLRTFNGPAMVDRCRSAWAEGRPVVLDYPNRLGLRKQATVVAARHEEVSEGMVLHLWVRARDPLEDQDQ